MSFPAKYPGKCGSCGEWFSRDDPIKRDSDGFYSHADCDAETPKPPRQPACETCWLEHPEGACDR